MLHIMSTYTDVHKDIIGIYYFTLLAYFAVIIVRFVGSILGCKDVPYGEIYKIIFNIVAITFIKTKKKVLLLLFLISRRFSNGCEWFQEWIDLLREMVIKLPQLTNLNLFRALCSEDADQDFFNNIIHLQVILLLCMLLWPRMFSHK